MTLKFSSQLLSSLFSKPGDQIVARDTETPVVISTDAATNGDVWTYDATTGLPKWATGGGGGSPVSGQSVTAFVNSTVNPGSVGSYGWGNTAVASNAFDTYAAFDKDGSALASVPWFDFTDPANPVITQEGEYLVCIMVNATISGTVKLAVLKHFIDFSDLNSQATVPYGTGVSNLLATMPAMIASANVPVPVGMQLDAVAGANLSSFTNLFPLMRIVKIS